jgi:hypothetical protein
MCRQSTQLMLACTQVLHTRMGSGKGWGRWRPSRAPRAAWSLRPPRANPSRAAGRGRTASELSEPLDDVSIPTEVSAAVERQRKLAERAELLSNVFAVVDLLGIDRRDVGGA